MAFAIPIKFLINWLHKPKIKDYLYADIAVDLLVIGKNF